MKTVVFSDAHLDVTEQGRERMGVLLCFLRELDPAQVERIIILGDLFDFWFEYRHVIFSGYFEVLRALADLRDSGVEFHFVCGNHDFWAGRFLERDLSFIVHRGSVVLKFGDRPVLLVHGDGINPKDWGYRIYKRIAQAKPVVWLFGLIHPDWAMGLARMVSRVSRRLFQTKDVSSGSEANALRKFARRTLARGEVDVVMCGHSHYPVREEHPTPDGVGLYINTGDWLYNHSYVEWDGHDFQIVLFRQAAAQRVSHGETDRPEQERDQQP